jgi:hypothetical protein
VCDMALTFRFNDSLANCRRIVGSCRPAGSRTLPSQGRHFARSVVLRKAEIGKSRSNRVMEGPDTFGRHSRRHEHARYARKVARGCARQTVHG